MAEAFEIDMSKTWRRRQRSRADIRRFWDSRYNRFIKAGFTEEEATWGANEGLSLKSRRVQDLIRHREGLVKFLIRKFNVSRADAIKQAAKDLVSKLSDANIGDLDLFYEVSP